MIKVNGKYSDYYLSLGVQTNKGRTKAEALKKHGLGHQNMPKIFLEDIEEMFDSKTHVQPKDKDFMAEGIDVLARSGRVLFRFEGDYYKYDRLGNDNRKELELIEMLKGSGYLSKLAWAEYATRKINAVEYISGTVLDEDYHGQFLTEVTRFVVDLRKDFAINLRDVHDNPFNVIVTQMIGK